MPASTKHGKIAVPRRAYHPSHKIVLGARGVDRCLYCLADCEDGGLLRLECPRTYAAPDPVIYTRGVYVALIHTGHVEADFMGYARHHIEASPPYRGYQLAYTLAGMIEPSEHIDHARAVVQRWDGAAEPWLGSVILPIDSYRWDVLPGARVLRVALHVAANENIAWAYRVLDGGAR